MLPNATMFWMVNLAQCGHKFRGGLDFPPRQRAGKNENNYQMPPSRMARRCGSRVWDRRKTIEMSLNQLDLAGAINDGRRRFCRFHRPGGVAKVPDTKDL